MPSSPLVLLMDDEKPYGGTVGRYLQHNEQREEVLVMIDGEVWSFYDDDGGTGRFDSWQAMLERGEVLTAAQTRYLYDSMRFSDSDMVDLVSGRVLVDAMLDLYLEGAMTIDEVEDELLQYDIIGEWYEREEARELRSSLQLQVMYDRYG